MSPEITYTSSANGKNQVVFRLAGDVITTTTAKGETQSFRADLIKEIRLDRQGEKTHKTTIRFDAGTAITINCNTINNVDSSASYIAWITALNQRLPEAFVYQSGSTALKYFSGLLAIAVFALPVWGYFVLHQVHAVYAICLTTGLLILRSALTQARTMHYTWSQRPDFALPTA